MITTFQASQVAGPCTVLHEVKSSRPELRDMSMVVGVKVWCSYRQDNIEVCDARLPRVPKSEYSNWLAAGA
jgi:hypothetical protein